MAVAAQAQTGRVARGLTPAVSTSQPGGDADSPVAPESVTHAGAVVQVPVRRSARVRPFGALAVSGKIGLNGIGADVATPLASWLNVRAGFQMYERNLLFKTDGLEANGDLTLGNIAVSLDVYPFHNSFRISPGITLHNDNHLTATLFVPGGQRFSLGDVDSTSATYDPIRGIARLRLGNPVAPRLTFGFGNMLKPGGGHLSLPVELGVQYTSAPTLSIVLTGSACDAQMQCGGVNDGDGTANLANEVRALESDLSGLRVFPIASIGLSYRFGHNPPRPR